MSQPTITQMVAAVNADERAKLRRLNKTIKHQEALILIAKVFVAKCHAGQCKSVKTLNAAERILRDIEGQA